jgi:hypothetical protein
MAAWDKIAVIDTEAGSGELYSHLGEYNVLPLTVFTPESYIKAITECEEAGMEVIIIDSITPEWETCLEIKETIAQTKFRGNSWSAWSETTPRHQKFIDKMITSRAHIITTVRNKIDTVMTDTKQVKKVGVKEVTREGWEYNLTLNFNIDRDTHKVTASKDRTEMFDNKDPFIITPDTGKQLMEWAMSGKEVPAPTPTVTRADIRTYLATTYPNLQATEYGTFIREMTNLDANTEDPGKVLEALTAAAANAQ